MPRMPDRFKGRIPVMILTSRSQTQISAGSPPHPPTPAHSQAPAARPAPSLGRRPRIRVVPNKQGAGSPIQQFHPPHETGLSALHPFRCPNPMAVPWAWDGAAPLALLQRPTPPPRSGSSPPLKVPGCAATPDPAALRWACPPQAPRHHSQSHTVSPPGRREVP